MITATAMVGSYENAVEYTDSFILTVEESVFLINADVDFKDDNVKFKALDRMNYYYCKNKDIHDIIDAQNLECDTCIFAFEGLGEGYGQISEIHPKGFLNAMMVVTKGNKIKYITRRASTLPDNRPIANKHTTLVAKTYDYHTGDHKNTYIALKPRTLNWLGWYREKTEENGETIIKFTIKGCTGINIHATRDKMLSLSSGYSEGCQTVYYEDYLEFGQAVGFLSKSGDYTITDEEEEKGISGLGNYMRAWIETTASNNDIYLKVKYILDRNYDDQNSYYADQLKKFKEGTDEYKEYYEKNKDFLKGIFYEI